MPNEIDELMNRDPLKLSEQDRAKIIDYHRAYRAKIEGGARPKKVLEEGQMLKIGPLLPRPVFKKRI